MIEEKEPTGWSEENGPIRLPNGMATEMGWLRFVELREMTGEEEDMIVNRRFAREGVVFNKILESCITSFATDDGKTFETPQEIKKYAAQLPLQDATYLTCRLRGISLGDVFRFRARCPSNSCGNQSVYVVDMSHQDRTYRDTSPSKTFDVTFSNGKVCTLRLLTAADNPDLARVKRESPDLVLTMQLFLQVETYDGEKLANYSDVQKWSTRIRNEVREAINENVAGMDLSVTNTCEGCGNEFQTTLPIVSQDFFFPSEAKNS